MMTTTRGSTTTSCWWCEAERVDRQLDAVMKINPVPIYGPWDLGITLDSHTISAEFLGYDLHGNPQFDTLRSELGELLFQLKYRGDRRASATLAAVAAQFIRKNRIALDLVVPVPPSRVRPFQPLMAIAAALANELGIAYDPRVLKKVKETGELKSVAEMKEREEALRGAFDVDDNALAGRRVLLLDDLYRSGASMREAANTLRSRGRVRSLTVLALTRTRSKG